MTVLDDSGGSSVITRVLIQSQKRESEKREHGLSRTLLTLRMEEGVMSSLQGLESARKQILP